MRTIDSLKTLCLTGVLCILLGMVIMLLIVDTIETKKETREADIIAEDQMDIYNEEVVVQFYDIPLKDGIQEHVMTICKWYGVDERLIFAMIERESQFDISAVGDGGEALGLMQIHPNWHGERMNKLGCDDLLNPFENVVVGIDYFAELVRMERGVEWALMAYNGGLAYASEMVDAGKVSDYASAVLYRAEELEYRDGGE